MLSVIYLAAANDSCQWRDQFKIFIWIFLLVVNFSFKTVTLEFNNHRFCIGSGLIGFKFLFGYSVLFQFASDGFCQVLHIFIFFFFHTWSYEAWSSRVYL